MDSSKFVGGKKFKLSGGGVTSTQNTITLQEFRHPDGTNITMADFGDVGHGTIEPGTQKREFITWTGVTQNSDGTATLTGVSRGKKPFAPYDSDPSKFAYSHGGGTVLIISNTPAFYNEFAAKDNDESITGIWTFSQTNVPRLDAPRIYVAGEEELFVTKRYVDNLAFAGAPDASITQKGLVEEATQAEFDAGTSNGATGARLAVNPSTIRAKKYHSFAASTSGSDTYQITVNPPITAYADGDVFVFEADVANTGVCSLNVNGLGPKTIKKYGNLDLADGDIGASSIVIVIYDADTDVLHLQTNVANPQLSQNAKEIYAASSAGTDAYAVTLTPTLTAYVDGLIVNFKADVANTGAATLNVNGLGAITIKKHHDQDLDTGDIEANQIVSVVYNSSTAKFQMISQTAVRPVRRIIRACGSFTRAANAASGNEVVAHGLGAAPTVVRVWGYNGSSQFLATSAGAYAGGSQSYAGGNSINASGNAHVGNGQIIGLVSIGSSVGDRQDAVLTVDATNLTFAFTKSGSPNSNTMGFVWEAEIESFT